MADQVPLSRRKTDSGFHSRAPLTMKIVVCSGRGNAVALVVVTALLLLAALLIIRTSPNREAQRRRTMGRLFDAPTPDLGHGRPLSA